MSDTPCMSVGQTRILTRSLHNITRYKYIHNNIKVYIYIYFTFIFVALLFTHARGGKNCGLLSHTTPYQILLCWSYYVYKNLNILTSTFVTIYNVKLFASKIYEYYNLYDDLRIFALNIGLKKHFHPIPIIKGVWKL